MCIQRLLLLFVSIGFFFVYYRNRRKGGPGGGRKTPGAPGTPQRRRSRMKSGDSASNISADETGQDSGTAGASSPGPFRFPKTKKSLMSDWLQESESNTANEDDDVSANYLKGSRSPPGISTHLLRSNAAQSPNKNVCSAKKRWLRQAISEDHSDLNDYNGAASPCSETAIDSMVTPLKKRRLANYKEDQELIGANESAEEMLVESSNETSPMKHVPNGLKKQILQNLVLEAVLDKAMEDMLSAPASTTTTENNAAAVDPVVKKEDSKSDHDDVPEVKTEDLKEENTATTTTTLATTKSTSPIKAPEPNSAFKSFFNSNVSLEALEAEIAATRKQREGSANSFAAPENNAIDNNIANKQLSFNHPTMALVAASTMETSSSSKAEVKNEQSELLASGHHRLNTDSSSVAASSIFEQNAASKSEVKKPSVIIPEHQQQAMPSMPMEAIANSCYNTKSETAPSSKLESWKLEEKTESTFLGHPQKNTEVKNEVQPRPSTNPPVSETKPKAKKRVSLADYKSLRKVNNSNNSSTCSTPLEATPPPSLAGGGSTTTSLSSSVPPLPVVNKTSTTTTTVIEQHPAHPDLTSSSTNQDPDVTPTQDEQQTVSSQLTTTGSATADRKSSLTSNSTAPADHPTSSIVGSTSLNNTLLVFEKLDKLEMVQQELKKKGTYIFFKMEF